LMCVGTWDYRKRERGRQGFPTEDSRY